MGNEGREVIAGVEVDDYFLNPAKTKAIVAESYLVMPLYQPYVLVAANNDIAGIQINAQGLFGYELLYRSK